jgi:hypothetical protein
MLCDVTRDRSREDATTRREETLGLVREKLDRDVPANALRLANASDDCESVIWHVGKWIPAFAGMTD